MILGNEIKKFTLSSGGISFYLLESGDVFTIEKGNIQINMYRGNNIVGSTSNLFLRVYDGKKIEFTKLIGIDSPSKFYCENNKAYYKGTFKNIEYMVVLTVLENMWFWEVKLTNLTKDNTKVDILYGQDVGISGKGGIYNNEAYTSQYIDHKVFKNKYGYNVCSRQNQGTPHYLQQGSLSNNVAYSTDGFQFFGLEYKDTNVPIAMFMNELENRIYQYEFAYTALQSEKMTLKDCEKFSFYGLFDESIHEVATEVRFEDNIFKAYEAINSNFNLDEGKLNKLGLKINLNNCMNALPFTTDEVNNYYPNQKHLESEKGKILSFFNPDSSHVVLKAKELLVERPHGNIIITGNNRYIKKELLSATHFIFGVFSSQVVVGNTSFNKLSSNVRNPLNVDKISGQRILIEMDGEYKLLGLPSSFELGINYSKWSYKLSDDILTVTSMVLVDQPELILEVASTRGIKYNFIVINHIVMGAGEYEHPFELEVKGNNLEFIPSKNSMCYGKYPNLRYNMILNSNFFISDDSIFYQDKKSRNQPIVSLIINSSDSFRIITQGRINGEEYPIILYQLEQVKENYKAYYRQNLNNFKLTLNNEEVEKFNDIVMWYTHHAFIHYSSPHGLEQYSGAAWGTRDVCQGPIEYFLATQQFPVVRDILLKVYSHQFKQTGDWPQWFMFDEYYKIQAQESHGDIIVWPLRSLALYLLATGDFSILNEKVPYTDLSIIEYTKETESIINHVLHEINSIKGSFIKGTHLSAYGGGDWDDTLQPANKELTKFMVSGWTVALTYQAINHFSEAIETYNLELSNELLTLAKQIKVDYEKYIIKDNIPAGFVLFDEDGIKYMLHPSDELSGLKYRLLPFNDGIIGEIFRKDQSEKYCDIIDKHLKHPDGVRLMNHTVKYTGGINTYFTRAETAANFGREIGLQYVHAHIRYVEAMAKLGKVDEVWDNLLVINPIKIQDVVPNALYRQSNTYFSSSDAFFYNRYEAMENFDKIKKGKVGVKGGWRIYSSGPGIYLNQLISNCLGYRIKNGDLVMDPILPKKLDGLKFDYKYENKEFQIIYHITGNSDGVNKIVVNNEKIEFTRLKNKYRTGGALIKKDFLEPKLYSNNNIIEVYL
ncbi:MAG: cellobiose phosphorylase [Haloplasmataceae bacterium]|jgi:cellobiose phosphorylase|nr:cellobiose phosphorylase [Haloplasmataceae bacterium]